MKRKTMRKKFLMLVLTLSGIYVAPPVFSFQTATLEEVQKLGKSITAGIEHTCVWEDSGIRCWGNNDKGQITIPELIHPRQISAGGSHTCALDEQGVKCWGGNAEGQTKVPSLKNPKWIIAGYAYTCAIEDDGAKCWGAYSNEDTIPPVKNPRQITGGHAHVCVLDDEGAKCWVTNESIIVETTVPALKHIREISAGILHTCALDDDGVHCWGRNEEGQAKVPFLKNPRQIAAGGLHTCALDEDGVKCWGHNQFGQTVVPPLHRPQKIVAGAFHTCALLDDVEELKCWGASVGANTGFQNPRQVATGMAHTCVLDDTGVKCFGLNESGQLEVPPLKRPLAIAAGGVHTCAIDEGRVKCWGGKHLEKVYWAEAFQGKVDLEKELKAPPLKNPRQVTAALLHTCALDDEGVECWGPGDLQVPPLKNPRSIMGSLNQICALDDEGVKCWGKELKPPFAFKNPKQVVAGGGHTCVLEEEGVKCWGDNKADQIEVPPLRNPVQIASGVTHTCALDDEGVKCWGWSQLEKLETMPWAFTPKEETVIPELYHPREITAGFFHSCAIDDDGVKCWGANGAGQSLMFQESTMGTISVPFHLFVSHPQQYLLKLKEFFPKNKADFLKDAAALAAPLTSQRETSAGIAYRRYLKILTLYEFVSPLLEETTSDVVQQRLLPRYKDALSQLRMQMEIETVQSVELTPQTTILILSLSAASLKAGKVYLSEESAHYDLEVMLQELGAAVAKLTAKTNVNEETLSQIRKIYRAHGALIQALVDSEKTRAFGMVLNKAQTYFEGKN